MIRDFDPYSLSDDDLLAHSHIIENECQDDAAVVFEGMTPYQIEHFVLGKIPPIGRYHQCCLEIRRRLDVMKGTRDAFSKLLEERADSAEVAEKRGILRVLQNEVVAFKEVADKYKNLTNGKSFEDPSIQEEYWDQHFGWRLAIAMISGGLSGDLIQSIMCLHEDSHTRRFLQSALRELGASGNEAVRSQIDQSLSKFIEEYRCVEDVKRPKLPTW
jgi:hypothetical protein